jgi:hypothetical protein
MMRNDSARLKARIQLKSEKPLEFDREQDREFQPSFLMPHDILDSSAWLECLEDGPNTVHFGPILHKLPDLIVPTVVITEVRKVALKQRPPEKAEEVTRALIIF